MNRDVLTLGRSLLAFALLGGLWCERSSASEWVDSHVAGPFECQAEFELGDYRETIDRLDGLRNDISATLSLELTAEPIEILLFRSRRSYVNYVSQRIPQGAGRQALFVKSPDLSRVYVYRHREMETDLRHEGTHAILHAMLPYIPMWLDEGLAEYFEVEQQARASDNPHQFRVKLGVRFGVYAHLTTLESKRELNDMDAADYRQSWAWVHFMLHGPPEAQSALRAYLADIRGGNPPGPLSQYLVRRVPHLERQFTAHFRSWQ